MGLQIIREAGPADTVILRFVGDVEHASAPPARTAIAAEIRTWTRLVLDLSGVTHMDSSGIGLLVGAFKSARIHNADLRLAALPREITQVMERTGLAKILPIYPTVEAAVEEPRDAA